MLLLPRLRSSIRSHELALSVPFFISLQLCRLHVLKRVLVGVVMGARAGLLPTGTLRIAVAHLIVLLLRSVQRVGNHQVWVVLYDLLLAGVSPR